MTLRAIKEHNAKLLIHPAVGMTKPGDVDHYEGSLLSACFKKIS